MENEEKEVAILGCGCFWCTEAIFQNLRGVLSVISGYSGGQTQNPTYEEVSSGKTGHAEVAKIDFNPAQISYHDLLEVFFALHNPTTKNRQGNDVGSQYRSVILYNSDNQKRTARRMIKQLEAEKVYDTPIVTEVVPFTHFYPAEDYHQKYYESHQNAPYCQFIISPKLTKLRKKFSKLVNDRDVDERKAI